MVSTYLVCFDVSMSARRRRRLSALLRGWGNRVQRSAFECRVDDDERAQLERRLRALMQVPCDRLHMWCVDRPERVWIVGTSRCAESAAVGTDAGGHRVL